MASMDMSHVMHGGMHGGMNMSNTVSAYYRLHPTIMGGQWLSGRVLD